MAFSTFKDIRQYIDSNDDWDDHHEELMRNGISLIKNLKDIKEFIKTFPEGNLYSWAVETLV